MIVRHFDIKIPEVAKDGWEQLPLGYYRMAKCISPERELHDDEKTLKRKELGYMSLGEFQQDCLLSILSEMNKEEVKFMELGAGWGRVCLNIAGAIDFKVINCVPKKYRCRAVEAEPTHYKWLREHFIAQDISGLAILAAVSDKMGSCRFENGYSPDYQYGQEIVPLRSRRGIPSIWNISRILKGNTVKVPMCTLDSLLTRHVDIVQMDVQGAEYNVIKGAFRGIRSDKIDYFLINIHHDDYSQMIPSLLSEKYELVIDLKRMDIGYVAGFPPIQCHDGIQMFKRKGI